PQPRRFDNICFLPELARGGGPPEGWWRGNWQKPRHLPLHHAAHGPPPHETWGGNALTVSPGRTRAASLPPPPRRSRHRPPAHGDRWAGRRGADRAAPRRPWDRSRRNRGGGRGPARSPRRTSRRAP